MAGGEVGDGEAVAAREGVGEAANLVLSLWAHSSFSKEVGPSTLGQGIAPITLTHNVASNAEVAPSSKISRRPAAPSSGGNLARMGGGYSGYAADPDGYRWEIANAGASPPTDLVVPAPERA